MAEYRYSAYIEGTDEQVQAFNEQVLKIAREHGLTISSAHAQERIWPGDTSVPERAPNPLANNEITDGPIH